MEPLGGGSEKGAEETHTKEESTEEKPTEKMNEVDVVPFQVEGNTVSDPAKLQHTMDAKEPEVGLKYNTVLLNQFHLVYVSGIHVSLHVCVHGCVAVTCIGQEGRASGSRRCCSRALLARIHA